MTVTAVSSPALPVPVRTPILNTGVCGVKLEVKQWSGSAKYRMVYAKLQSAIAEGRVAAGTTLAEVTSGSTGVALAYAGRHLGLSVELHALASISAAKRERIRAYGARLVLHPEGTPVSSLLDSVRDRAARGLCWHLDQYDRRSLITAYEDLGHELVGQLREAGGVGPEAVACPVGTGGLIQGVGTSLRKAFPGIRVLAVEPGRGVAIDGIRNTDEFHLGDGDPYDRSFPDEVLHVRRPDCPSFVQGVPLGESASAVLEALQSRPELKILVIAPD
ncbi:MAG TPA: pyridoxal-phosphate dependent enzyme [Planctomycetota bacterium]|nr:pyridoxal-phosphate dependent enzyme [Planctomycetota bacterium]